MQINHIKREWLGAGIILLFIGVAVAPSINQHVVAASNDDERRIVQVTRRNQIVRQPNIIYKRIIDLVKKGMLLPILSFFLL